MTIPELECCLCASVMDEPTAKLGPNICTALSYAPDMWESPEATKVICGIKHVIDRGRPTHRMVVREYIDSGYYSWLGHKSFTQGLPLSVMEQEALTLVEHYRNKQLVAIMGDAYYLANGDHSKAPAIARKLWGQLEEVLCK